ncbi:MAG: DUF2288 family protein [Myxococcales bacterium]|nr:DUF2288 family protein [Myxococcales bacterium]
MDLREKLAAELLPTGWSTLAPHFARDALFVVAEGVSLLDVAVAVAEDRSAEVGAWLEAGQLARPSAAQARAWADAGTARFVIAIVQPFVLAQPVEHFG